MIDSLLEELPQHNDCDQNEANRTSPSGGVRAKHSLLTALPIVHRIIARRSSRLDPANRSDLLQEVALRIWRWGTKYPEKSEQMSGEDWTSFAARTTYNEVNRQLSRDGRHLRLSLDELSEIEDPSVEGQTDAEVFSLIEQVWQATCALSLRQRRSLLLHSQELIIYLLQIGITEKELAAALDFSEKDWNDVCDRLPMTDAEIAERTEGTAGSIKKARYEARVKLEGSIRR